MRSAPMLVLAAVVAACSGDYFRDTGPRPMKVLWEEGSITVSALDDVDGDGRDELLVGAPGAGPDAGRVRALSGADWRTLRDVGGKPGERFGAAVRRLEDLDADSIADRVTCANEAEEGRGRLEVRSGASGELLRSLAVSRPWKDPAARHGPPPCFDVVGDVDGDGRTDLVTCDPLPPVQAEPERPVHLATVRSVRDGRQLLDLGRWYGLPEPVGDLDGDGSDDLLCRPRGKRAGVVSGADGRLLQELDEGWATRQGWRDLGVEDAEDREAARFGVRGAVRLGDLDGDGLGEVALSVGDANHPRRAIWVVEGAGLQLLTSSEEPGLFTEFGNRGSLALGPDCDGDGRPDSFVGARDDEGKGASKDFGSVSVLSSFDGRLLRKLFGEHRFASLGSRITALGDLDGDGREDFGVHCSRECWKPAVRICSGSSLE